MRRSEGMGGSKGLYEERCSPTKPGVTMERVTRWRLAVLSLHVC